jgi:hypothetical protein
MSRLLLTLLLIVLAVPSAALERADVERVMKDPVEGRKAVVTEALALTPQQAEIFWPIYEDYLLELSHLGDARRQVKQEYSAVLRGMSDDVADAMLLQFLELEESEVDLRTRYFRKFQKELSAGLSVRLFQIDQQINLLVRFQSASRLAAQ